MLFVTLFSLLMFAMLVVAEILVGESNILSRCRAELKGLKSESSHALRLDYAFMAGRTLALGVILLSLVLFFLEEFRPKAR